MRAYRTESSYYFSSKQLLPAGALVFFSDKHRRYVHPTAGTLLDPHPRLEQPLDQRIQEPQNRRSDRGFQGLTHSLPLVLRQRPRACIPD